MNSDALRLHIIILMILSVGIELRLIRNQLAHDYEDNSEELVIILNKIFSLKNTLENYYVSIYQKLFSSINELSK